MNPLEYAVPAAMTLFSLSIALAFIRLVRGPSLPDRVVALDLIGLTVVAMITGYSIETNEPLLLWPAAALALISFLASVAFAYYVQRKGLE